VSERDAEALADRVRLAREAATAAEAAHARLRSCSASNQDNPTTGRHRPLRRDPGATSQDQARSPGPRVVGNVGEKAPLGVTRWDVAVRISSTSSRQALRPGSNAAGAGNRPHRSYQVGSEGDALVFVEGGDVFTMRERATWRWRPQEDGSFEVAAWRDGTSPGVAVVPAGVSPGGTST